MSELIGITFMRHGRSRADDEEVAEGRYDSPLTEVGRSQARARGEELKERNLTFDLAIVSTLVRASETAEIVAGYLALRVELNQEWMEIDNGLVAGVPLDELVALATDHGAHVDEVVERAIDLFERHVHSDDPGSDQQLVEVVRALVPAVTRLVAQHFHRTLVARARARGQADGADVGMGLAEALMAADADRLEVEVRWR